MDKNMIPTYYWIVSFELSTVTLISDNNLFDRASMITLMKASNTKTTLPSMCWWNLYLQLVTELYSFYVVTRFTIHNINVSFDRALFTCTVRRVNCSCTKNQVTHSTNHLHKKEQTKPALSTISTIELLRHIIGVIIQNSLIAQIYHL